MAQNCHVFFLDFSHFFDVTIRDNHHSIREKIKQTSFCSSSMTLKLPVRSAEGDGQGTGVNLATYSTLRLTHAVTEIKRTSLEHYMIGSGLVIFVPHANEPQTIVSNTGKW